MKSKISIFLLLLSLLALSGCEKFVQVGTPPNQLAVKEVFDNEESAIAAFSGIYADLSSISSVMSADLSIVLSLYSDELYLGNNVENYRQFYVSEVLPNNGIAQNGWSHLYKYIYNINNAIEGLKGSEAIREGIKNELLAEAFFLRSFCYFYLINLYGDVPLVLQTDFDKNQRLPKVETAEIYTHIIVDLNTSLSLFQNAIQRNEGAFPNSFASKALLARTNLYLGNWADAFELANEIIDSGEYELEDIEQVFLTRSRETIWHLLPVVDNYNTNLGRLLIPSSSTRVPNYIISDGLLESFEPNDERFDSWLAENTVGINKYSYPFKYKVNRGSEITENLSVFRLAEQYLIRAEAKIHLDDMLGAVEDINILRKARGLSDVAGNVNMDAVFSYLELERRHELFAEWGHRYFDLRRWGMTKPTLQQLPYKNWNENALFLPIPLSQLEANPLLVQNPGY